MFQKKLRAIADDSLKGVTKAAKEGLKSNPEFRKLEKKIELLLGETTSGADRHPKLRTMKDLVIFALELLPRASLIDSHLFVQIVKHFEQAYNAANESGTPAVTRCMVFCSFREGVTEIVVCAKFAFALSAAHTVDFLVVV